MVLVDSNGHLDAFIWPVNDPPIMVGEKVQCGYMRYHCICQSSVRLRGLLTYFPKDLFIATESQPFHAFVLCRISAANSQIHLVTIDSVLLHWKMLTSTF